VGEEGHVEGGEDGERVRHGGDAWGGVVKIVVVVVVCRDNDARQGSPRECRAAELNRATQCTASGIHHPPPAHDHVRALSPHKPAVGRPAMVRLRPLHVPERG
jgi:hypothetical protein